MLALPAVPGALSKRPLAWASERLDTLEHRIIQRAGRLTKSQGELTLTMSANHAVHQDLLHFIDVVKKQHNQNVADGRQINFCFNLAKNMPRNKKKWIVMISDS